MHAFRKFYLLLLLTLPISTIFSQPFEPALFNAMKWRMIGPHRGGRTVGAVGVAQEPNVFYIGVNNSKGGGHAVKCR